MVLKYALAAFSLLAIAALAVLAMPAQTLAFAFASADGRHVLIYACAPKASAQDTATNARRAHDFFLAELEVSSGAEVSEMLASLTSEGTSAFGPAQPGLQSLAAVRADIARNLQATHGCRLLNAHSAQI